MLRIDTSGSDVIGSEVYGYHVVNITVLSHGIPDYSDPKSLSSSGNTKRYHSHETVMYFSLPYSQLSPASDWLREHVIP